MAVTFFIWHSHGVKEPAQMQNAFMSKASKFTRHGLISDALLTAYYPFVKLVIIII